MDLPTPVKPPLRLLLIDDNETFLKHAARFLGREAALEVLDSCTDAVRGVEQTQALQPDVVLLDLSMPGTNGFSVLPLLIKAAPRARFVAVTMMEEAAYRERFLQAGGHGFVSKSRLTDELLPELRRQQAVQRGTATS